MDWHPVISVQPQTPDNDFCHFSISNVRFAFWVFFRKSEKLGSRSHRVKMMTRWPGRERWPKWPIDPVTQWFLSMSGVGFCWRTPATSSALWRTHVVYGTLGNLLSDHGVVERNRISSLQSHGKALEKQCCLPGVFRDSGDAPVNL